MQIITINSPNKSILYKTAKQVATPLTQNIVDKIESMRAFYKISGDKSGFAAPQVGISLRIILIESDLFGDNPSKEPVILINPEWQPINNKKGFGIEGCLSVPDKSGIVERFMNVKLTALKYDPATKETTPIERDYYREFSSLLWQHEIDHLDGDIFADKASVMLTQEEINLIIQFLFETKKITPTASIFDIAPHINDIGLAYQKQTMPLYDFLVQSAANRNEP